MKKNQLLKSVYKDCEKKMRKAVLILSSSEIIAGLIYILTSNTVGEFADAAFDLNLNLGIKNALILLVYLVLSVLVIPIVSLIGNCSMFKQALIHDRLIFNKFLDKSIEKVMSLDSGDVQFQLEDAPNSLRIYWVIVISKGIAIPISLAYLLFNALSINVNLTILIFVVSISKLFIPLLLQSKQTKYENEEKSYRALRRAMETEITKKPYLIKVWGLSRFLNKKINASYNEYHKKTEFPKIIIDNILSFCPTFVEYLGTLIIFSVGVIAISKKFITPGNLLTMIAYLSVIQELLIRISDVIGNIPLLIVSAKRTSEIYKDGENKHTNVINSFEKLKLDQIDYAYNGRKVFEKFNFSIRRGEKVLVVGDNGTGKSTLVKLICTLLKPTNGSLIINNQDVFLVDINSYRNLFAYAPQEPYLFNATVKENITFKNPQIDKDEYDNLMEIFNMKNLSNKMVVSNEDLSGGEKQKVSIIRALLKNSDFVILDEPTNHLDKESILKLKSYLENTDKTIIIVTHDAEIYNLPFKKIRL